MAKQVHVDISVFGDKELQKRLNKLPIAIEKNVVKDALKEGAEPIKATAQRLAPVLTGRMRDSLAVRALKKQRRGRFGVQVVTGTREELGIAADDKYYYPMGVETGHGNVPAHPFMRPALEQNRDAVLNLVAGLIADGIERETIALGGTHG